MITRRLFCSTVLSIPMWTTFSAPPALAEPITLSAVAAAIVKAAAAELGKRVVNSFLSTVVYSGEIAGSLKRISEQLATITRMIAEIPGLVRAEVRQLMMQETAAIVESFQPQVDSIIAGSRTARVTKDQRARLNIILVDLQSAVDRIWTYGSPSVYPVASFGILLTITIHRLLGSPAREVTTFVNGQVNNRFSSANDPNRSGSFANLLKPAIESMNDHANYLERYPRYGLIGYNESRPIRSLDGPNDGQCFPVGFRVSPTGIPESPARYTGNMEGGGEHDPFFPSVFDESGSRICHGKLPRGVENRVLDHLNARLDLYREKATLVSELQRCIKDVTETGEALKAAAA